MQEAMKRTKTRFLDMLLALVLVFTSLPATALAATTDSSDDNWGKLSVEDVTDELTDADRKSMFEENMDTDKVSESELPDPDELVRVIVELDTDSLLDVRDRVNSAMSMTDFQRTQAAQDQLSEISTMEADVKSAIAAEGIEPEYVFSYAAIISGFSAEVPYGDIEAIEAVDGVARVVLCETYYPDVMGDATLGEALSPAEIAAYFTPVDLTVTETGKHNAALTWTAAKQADLESVTYTVERSLAHKVSDGEQDTWVYDGFEILAEGLTECAYTDTTTLNIGCTYAYRVTTFAGTKTGPGAIAALYIDASADDPDEQAVLEIIKKIEALKPIDLLTAADEQRVRELLAEYNALTDAQKELVFNYQTLLDAIEQVGHNPERVNAKDATCTEPGYTGDLVCSVCNEVLEAGTVIDPLGHSYGEPAWTWTEDGTAATATFTCGNDESHTVVLDGDITSEITREAACGVAGEETFTATVTFAGKTYTDSKVLATAALDHDPEVRNAKDATCTEDGYTGDTVCKRCSETLATGSAIPALGHDTEVKNARAATCTEAGYTGDTVCKRCGQTVATGSSISATGHHYGSDGKCKDCGDKQTVTPATGDTFDVAMTTLVLMTSAVLAAALWFSMRKRSK